jgi:hypothetical protein
MKKKSCPCSNILVITSLGRNYVQHKHQGRMAWGIQWLIREPQGIEWQGMVALIFGTSWIYFGHRMIRFHFPVIDYLWENTLYMSFATWPGQVEE